MFNPMLKIRETLLFFLIVVINGLTCIDLDIGLDTRAMERWRKEVLAIRHLLDYSILGETSQKSFAPVTKFSQLRA